MQGSSKLAQWTQESDICYEYSRHVRNEYFHLHTRRRYSYSKIHFIWEKKWTCKQNSLTLNFFHISFSLSILKKFIFRYEVTKHVYNFIFSLWIQMSAIIMPINLTRKRFSRFLPKRKKQKYVTFCCMYEYEYCIKLCKLLKIPIFFLFESLVSQWIKFKIHRNFQILTRHKMVQ